MPSTLPKRHSIRLNGYDYSQAGAYFITLCTHNQVCLFGDIMDGEMILNNIGWVVRDEWEKTEKIRAEIILDEYVIMPNHFHAIVYIVESQTNHTPDILTRTAAGPQPKSIGAMVAGFKASVTRQINASLKTRITVWQRNYWEHIIRSEQAYEQIAGYILSNPANWSKDQFSIGYHP